MRIYIKEALESVALDYKNHISKQLIVLPTGTGKTHVAGHLPDHLSLPREQQFWFIVDRDELAQQAVARLSELNPTRSIEIEKAEEHADPRCNIIVASVQTVSRGTNSAHGWAPGPRLTKFNPDAVSIIVVDEAHHSVSARTQRVLRYLQCLKGDPSDNNRKLLIGLTATPRRADAIGLEEIFDKITYQRSTLEMINERWLVDVNGYRVWTQHDISGVRTVQGDYEVRELENTINTPTRNRLAVDKYKELGEGLPFLAFTTAIQHTKDLAACFQAQDISCVPIWGEMPLEDRRSSIEAFRNRKIQGLASCSVLNEGFDAPVASVGLFTRPTRSGSLYEQQLGRLLRPFPTPESMYNIVHPPDWVKKHAIAIDLVDNIGRHPPMTLASLFGLRHDFNVAGKSITTTVKVVQQLEEQHPEAVGLWDASDLDQIKTIVEKVAIFRQPRIPQEAREFSQFRWMEQTSSIYHLAMPERCLVMVTNQLGQRELYDSRNGHRYLIGTWPNAKSAFKAADSLVPQESVAILLADAKWHTEAPTEKQAAKLFYMDRRIRDTLKIQNPNQFYWFCIKRFKAGDLAYTKGGLSQQISSRDVAHNIAR